MPVKSMIKVTYFVAAAGVAPHVFVHPDDGDAVEPAGSADEHASGLGEDRVVRGVEGHLEPFGDPGDGEVLTDDPFQRPPHTTT